MAKSRAGEEMDELQSQLRPLLEERGYRLRTRTFNRTTTDGLTQVISFQMGQRYLQGKFTVNVGVYVPEVVSVQYGSRVRSFVQEPECCVRQRLGMIGPERCDRWSILPLDATSIKDLRFRLERDAFPFLAVRNSKFSPRRIERGEGKLRRRVTTAYRLPPSFSLIEEKRKKRSNYWRHRFG